MRKRYKVMLFTFLPLILLLEFSHSSTHWIVTEEGKIQAQEDSVFSLKCPYNLMTFLQQEQRLILLQQLKQQLVQQKQELDTHEDNDTDYEREFLTTNEDCLEAGKQLVDMDLYVSAILTPQHKNILIQDYTIPPDHHDYSNSGKVLDCTAYYSLEYSIHAFEHLNGVSNRNNLSMLKEPEILEYLPFMQDEHYVSYLKDSLQQNSSSWLHYTMGGFHWRLLGNSTQAVECLRRALHFAPREYKDIALISLANLLHKHRYSTDAAVLLHAALIIDQSQAITHYSLANVYASLSEVNKSLICYEKALVFDRLHLTQARVRRRAVLCHMKLEALLESKHRKLQNQLENLRKYQEKHSEWQRLQRKVLMEQESDQQNIEKILFQHFKNGARNNKKLSYEYNHRGKKSRKANTSNEGASKEDEANDDIQMDASSHFGDWPSKGECERNIDHYPLWSEFQTVFLPPDQRGFDVSGYLGISQGLEPGQSHPFPWYPPTCQLLPSASTSSSDSFDIFKSYGYLSMQNKALLKLKIEDHSMKEVLLGWVGSDVTIEEVGQRILTALKQSTGPDWLLYNVAGLYWRVVGEPLQAVQCINNALITAPQEHKHLALVNLANVLYKLGKVKDALEVMHDVLAISHHEPESLLLTGNLYAALGSVDEAVLWYQRGLHQDAFNQQALLNLRMVLCLKKFHRGNTRYQQRAPETEEEEDSKTTKTNKNKRSNDDFHENFDDTSYFGEDPLDKNTAFFKSESVTQFFKENSGFNALIEEDMRSFVDSSKFHKDMKNSQQIGLFELCQKILQNPHKKKVKLINPSSGQEAYVEHDFCKQLINGQGKKSTCIIKNDGYPTLTPCDIDPFADMPEFSDEGGIDGK